MSDTNDQDDQLLKNSAHSLGAVLKKARESKNLSQRDIANSLKLSVAMIEALEREDEKKLPPKIFVRGYYRSYAKLVGVTHHVFSEDSAATGTGPQLTKVRESDSIVKVPWLKILLAIVALGLAFFAWQANQAPPPSSTNAVGLVEPNQSAVISSVPVEAETEENSSPLVPANSDNAPTPPNQDVHSTPSVAEERSIEHEMQESQPQPNVTSMPATNDSVSDLERDNESLNATEGVVVIRFSGKSWTEITDVSGARVVFGLIKEGDVKRISEGFPLDIKLGNASQVAVTVNDKNIDLAPHIRGNVARFKLDPSKY